MANLFLPARDWAQHWLARGIVPLWNPQAFGGVPFLGAMQAAVFYPPNLILGALLSPIATINILRLAHIYLFGALTWHFLRAERGLVRPAALLGAIAVAGSAHVASHTDHINQLAAMAWLPALVTCQWRWWRTGRPLVLVVFAAVLTLQILAGHPQAVFYSILLTAAIALAFLISDFGFWILDSKTSEPQIVQIDGASQSAESVVPKALESAIRHPPSAIKSIGGPPAFQSKILSVVVLLLAIAGGFLLASVQMVPTAETSRLSRRAADELDYALFGSTPARFLVTAIAPRAFGDPLKGYTDRRFGAECSPYVGDLTVILALVALGVAIVRHRPYAIFWALVVAVAFTLALGGYGPFWSPGHPSPLYRAYLWLLPPARHLRVPPRILLLSMFPLAVLGAEGLNWLWRLKWWTAAESRKWIRSVAAWAAVAVLALELWAFQRGEFHNRVVRYYPPHVMLTGEPREVLGLVLHSSSPETTLTDFRIFRLLGTDDPDYLLDPSPAAVRNRSVRLQPNLGMLLDVADIEGYEEGLLPPLRYFDFLNFFNRNLRNTDPDAVLLAMMNVRYLYADERQLIQSPTWRPVGAVVEPETGRRYHLYENPLWLPRVIWADWLPREIALGQLRGSFSRGGPPSERMNEKQNYGLHVGTIAARGWMVEPAKRATLSIRSIEPNRIVVDSWSPHGGTLVVAQNAYPGWVVEAAGATLPMLPATDFSGMAVVPPGAREITILYRPFSFRVGAYLTAVGLAVWVAVLIIVVSRGKSESASPGEGVAK